MDLLGTHHIAGNRTATATRTHHGINPVSGESLEPPYHEATAAEVDRAANAAREAFAADRHRPAEDRADLLEAIAVELERLDETLVERACAETGLPPGRIRGERGRTTGQLRMFAALVREGSWVDARIDRALPDRAPIAKPDLRRMLVSLGPVAVFGASNFPLAFSVAGGDTASALAAGCPVVCKAHPAHPGTSELVAGAIDRAVASTGFHAGTFSLVFGAAPETSVAVVSHPQIKAVGFTGSLGAGRALFNAAAERPEPIPVYAEMGSVNPVFLLPGALESNPEGLATGLTGSVTLGSGQFCTNPGLVFAVRGAGLAAFATALEAGIRACPAFTLLHGGIQSTYESGLRRWAAESDSVGVRASGEATSNATAQAAVFRTTASNFIAKPGLGEEVFGPATLLVECDSIAEMITAASTLSGNLTATFHGTEADLDEASDLVDRMRDSVGRLIFNGFPTGVEVCPSMNHGGPYPATTDSRSTSVGTAAILRFARPICFQDFPASRLPVELHDENPRGIWRLVDGELTR